MSARTASIEMTSPPFGGIFVPGGTMPPEIREKYNEPPRDDPEATLLLQMHELTKQVRELTVQLKPLAETTPTILEMVRVWQVGHSVGTLANWMAVGLKWLAAIVSPLLFFFMLLRALWRGESLPPPH